MISVVIPACNEASNIAVTIRSFVDGRRSGVPVEIIVADDASTDGTGTHLPPAVGTVPVRVLRSRRRLGVARSRNRAAAAARGDLLFITDGHVEVDAGWDRVVLDHAADDRILAAAIVDRSTGTNCFGCRLVVPYMGTYWNMDAPKGPSPVQIASSAGTVLPRRLFEDLGGYDEGIRVYGAAEPEFSLRAWLSGANISCIPDLRINHHFKPKSKRDRFLSDHRTNLIHNNLRFGLCYLSQSKSLEMIRHYAMKFPRHFPRALALLVESDVWQRRAKLAASLRYDFDWFVAQFDLHDQVGRPILPTRRRFKSRPAELQCAS
ncbi:MAG: glycosyltransferase [Alphaproteobacteria bacterium]|nr:MAG: glycosyltransferase [Alphaproteobacteria bacterium]